MLDKTEFQPTEEKTNLIIKGSVKLFDVYKIPIDRLRYNAQNGRIATWISEYENEHGDLPTDQEQFNATIEGYIYDAGPDTLNATKNNIEKFGQQEAAVVLSNGILVDGNRRFTALRRLSREGKGQQFNYINAVLLPDQDYTTKEIKTLELNLQHAKEERVDYSPVDRLVDTYRDLIGPNKSFEPKEYAREIDSTEKKVKDEMRVVQLLVDYLDYIHHPGQFFVARQQKLDGPLREVDKILKSRKLAPEDYQDAKDILFASMVSMTGDVTRKVRGMSSTILNPHTLHHLADELDDTLNDIEDSFSDDRIAESSSDATAAVIDVPKRVTDNLVNIVDQTVDREKMKNAEKRPLQDTSKALDLLRNIDSKALEHCSDGDKKQISTLLLGLDKQIQKITSELNVK